LQTLREKLLKVTVRYNWSPKGLLVVTDKNLAGAYCTTSWTAMITKAWKRQWVHWLPVQDVESGNFSGKIHAGIVETRIPITFTDVSSVGYRNAYDLSR